MKAVVFERYGPPDVLQLVDVETPVPEEDQVLVRVHAASINAGDYRVRTGRPLLLRPMLGGLRRPKERRVGMDVAGRVEAVGRSVTRFRAGDEVFGCATGALSEYVVAGEDRLVPKPPNRSFEQAAAVPVAAITALQGLRAGGICAGQKVLIQGASGGVGTFAVQLAGSSGAEVTGVCSTRNLDMVRSIGAHHVIDYTREDFTRNEECYDLILAVNGYRSLFGYRRALCPRGTYVCAGGTLPQFLQAMALGPLVSRKGGKTMTSMGIAKINREDLLHLAQLLENGTIDPVIDRLFPLGDVVDAFRYVEDTHARGKVVMVVKPGS